MKHGEIHVWRVRLDREPRQVQALLQLLLPDERCLAAKFRVELDRNRFIFARGALRNVLGRYLSMDPDLIRFSYNRYGKPSLDHSNCALRFNVAHSRGLAFIAVASGREVGIDVEFVDPQFAFMKTARRVFSSEEYSWLRSMDPASRVPAFFSCWTRKEALLKAVGTGFSDESEEIMAGRNWTVANLHVSPRYKAALAVEGKIDSIRYPKYDDQAL